MNKRERVTKKSACGWMLLGLLLLAGEASGQRRRRDAEPVLPDHGVLKRVYFNLYTDSIKPVLNYYVNVEGEYAGGRILPLDSATVRVSCDVGRMDGLEWVVRPGMPRHEKVTFTVEARANSALRDQVTVWVQKRPDDADAEILRQPTGRRP